MGLVQSAAAKPVGRGLTAKHTSCRKITKFCQVCAACMAGDSRNCSYSMDAKRGGHMAHRCKWVAQIHVPDLSRAAGNWGKKIIKTKGLGLVFHDARAWQTNISRLGGLGIRTITHKIRRNKSSTPAKSIKLIIKVIYYKGFVRYTQN